MGRFVTVACGLIALGCVGLALHEFLPGSNPPSQEPRGRMDLEISPSPLIFDSVPYRGVAEKTLTLTNAAQYSITVSGVSGSCGCMQIPFRSTTLPPGKSIAVKVLMSGDTNAGAKGGRITVYSNSATNARTEIVARATEIRGITTLPEVVDFGRHAPANLPVTIPFKVVINGLGTSQRDRVRVTSELPNVEVGRIAFDDNGDATLDLQLRAGETVGHVSSRLAVDVPGFDKLWVTVVGVIDSPVRATPPTLLLTSGDSKPIRVRNAAGEAVPIQSATCSESLREILQCQPAVGSDYDCVCQRQPGSADSVVRGTIELRTENPAATISVPVTLFSGR